MFFKTSSRSHVVLALETSLDGDVGIHYVVRKQGLERVKGGWRPVYCVIEARRAEDPVDSNEVEVTLLTWVRLYKAECASRSLARYLRRRHIRIPEGLPVVDLGRLR